MVNIIRFGSELCGEVLLNIEVVLGICIRQVLVVRVLGDIKLVRHERTYTTKLQDALATIEDGKLVYRRKVFLYLLYLYLIALDLPVQVWPLLVFPVWD